MTTDTTPLDPCLGEPAAETTTNECVIFARADASNAGQDGTREHPLVSLQDAIDHAAKQHKRVFACDSAPFKEAIVIDAPVEVWGGFDCDKDWHYASTDRAILTGVPDRVSATISALGAGAKLVGFTIQAPESELPGGSSIALVVDKVEADTFVWRCDLFPSNGKDGKDGDPPGPAASIGGNASDVGAAGAPNAACVDPASVSPGAPGVTNCDDGKSEGGHGGIAGAAPNGAGQAGLDGQPVPIPNPSQLGHGGDGQTAGSSCTDGSNGRDGLPGEGGMGGLLHGFATLTGIKPSPGLPGAAGKHGQGGGGGGAAKAGLFCSSGGNTVAGVGASGGGGGGGGCGGKGGNGGQSGGMSVGLIVLGYMVNLKDVFITPAQGGRGGDGAAGQAGGPGGNGAAGGAASGMGSSLAACGGGMGGHGGMGGSGGGGHGGDSIGIAYVFAMPHTQHVISLPGKGGYAGQGGPGNEIMGAGKDGVGIEAAGFGNPF